MIVFYFQNIYYKVSGTVLMSGAKRDRGEQPQSNELHISPYTDIWVSVKKDELELNIHEKHDTPVKYGPVIYPYFFDKYNNSFIN
jgi:hypothetical protein